MISSLSAIALATSLTNNIDTSNIFIKYSQKHRTEQTFLVDPFDSERLFGVKLADVSHLRAQRFIADSSAQVCDQHITNSTHNTQTTLIGETYIISISAR